MVWYDRLFLFWDLLEQFPFGTIFSLLWFEMESLLSLIRGICLAHAGSAMQIKLAGTLLLTPPCKRNNPCSVCKHPLLVAISFVGIQNLNPQITPAYNKVKLIPGPILVTLEKS